MSPGYSEFAHRGIVPTRKVEERLPEWPTLKNQSLEGYSFTARQHRL